MSAKPPIIVSVSRRTDVPALYGEWFRRRLDAGWCETRNPFSGRLSRVSLAREDVLGWVFWSRNYSEFLDVLHRLHDDGQRFLCHFTLTGMPDLLEPKVPEAGMALHAAREIAEAFGPSVLLWRYDPVLLTLITPPAWHRERFAELAALLEGLTERCIFSFPTMYCKTERNLERLSRKEKDFRVYRPGEDFRADDLRDLVRWMAERAARHGMQLACCCGERWADASGGVEAAQCVDWPLLRSLFASPPDFDIPRRPSRAECGCFQSVDIGRYGTCAHGCAYCYAVDGAERAEASWQSHDPGEPCL